MIENVWRVFVCRNLVIVIVDYMLLAFVVYIVLQG